MEGEGMNVEDVPHQFYGFVCYLIGFHAFFFNNNVTVRHNLRR